MNILRMGVIVGLMASSVVCAGILTDKEIADFNSGLKKGLTESSSKYVDRLQGWAGWMFFEAIHWNAANNSGSKCENYAIEWGYATEMLAYWLDSSTIKMIDQKVTKLGAAKDKLALLQEYYTLVYKVLEAKGALEGPFKRFTPNLPS